MNKLLTYSLIAIGLSLGACQSKAKKETEKAETEATCTKDCNKCEKSPETKLATNTNVAGVYYFHGDRRCKTCKAVGSTAKEVAEKLNVPFFDINFDQKENKTLAEKFQVSSSGLFIKYAKSGKVEDLTTFAFRTAINDTPAYIEKLENTIKANL